MSVFGMIMGGFCVASVTLILWLLAVEGAEFARKRRMTPPERRLSNLVDVVDRRHRAQEADRASREKARERFGR